MSILPFVSRAARAAQDASSPDPAEIADLTQRQGRQDASSPDPAGRDARRDVLTGDIPSDAARFSDPMRRLVVRRCSDCAFTYMQPAAVGACPHCHGPHVETVDEHTIYAPRV